MRALERGRQDCMLDDIENCPFASIGGLERRTTPTWPKYIGSTEAEDYILGYVGMAQEIYGDDWQLVRLHGSLL